MTTRGQEQKDREGFEFEKWWVEVACHPKESLDRQEGCSYSVKDTRLAHIVWEYAWQASRAHLLQELTEQAAVEGEVSAEELRGFIRELGSIDSNAHAKYYSFLEAERRQIKALRAFLTQDRARVAAKLRAENEDLQKKWEAAVQIYTDESIKVGVLEDEVESLRERVRELEGALTPSTETKQAYMGEFKFQCGELTPNVPWTTVKEIMRAILAHANGGEK